MSKVEALQAKKKVLELGPIKGFEQKSPGGDKMTVLKNPNNVLFPARAGEVQVASLKTNSVKNLEMKGDTNIAPCGSNAIGFGCGNKR